MEQSDNIIKAKELTTDNLLNVVERLVGPIEPVGDEAYDKDRLENLKHLVALSKQLHIVIDKIAADYKDSRLASVHRIGKFADDYLDWLGIPAGKVQQIPMWKRAKENIPYGECEFYFTLDEGGEMSPYYATQVEKGQYYLSDEDLKNLPKED